MMPAPKLAEVAFEEFLKELPADYAEQAREFKAFTRSRKVRTPADLLQLLMLYCGLDQALRTTAGSFTLWQERLTDTAIRQRLMACGPWLKALLHRMLPAAMTAVTGFRLLVVDGSSLQGPGATGTDYRVHLVLDLTNLIMHVVQVTGVEGAESLARYPWQAGDIVLADRGYNQPQVILELSARQVWVVVRLMPTAMPLYLREIDEEQRDPAAARLDVAAHLRAATGDTVTVPVWLRGQQTSGPGWLHAVRLPPAAAAAARERCRKVAKRKGWTPSAAALFLDGIHHRAAGRGGGERRAVALSLPLASGVDVQTAEKPARPGPPAHPATQCAGHRLDSRQIALCVGDRTTHSAPEPSGLGPSGPAPPGHPLALGGARPPPGRCLDSRSPPPAPRALGGMP